MAGSYKPSRRSTSTPYVSTPPPSASQESCPPPRHPASPGACTPTLLADTARSHSSRLVSVTSAFTEFTEFIKNIVIYINVFSSVRGRRAETRVHPSLLTRTLPTGLLLTWAWGPNCPGGFPSLWFAQQWQSCCLHPKFSLAMFTLRGNHPPGKAGCAWMPYPGQC